MAPVPRRLSHVAVNSPRIAEMMAFYERYLAFRLSDWLADMTSGAPVSAIPPASPAAPWPPVCRETIALEGTLGSGLVAFRLVGWGYGSHSPKQCPAGPAGDRARERN